jgi:probable F420-dependent oxidoreductase
MDLGVFYFPTDYGIDVAELARALEDRGFKSLYVPEHTHIPLSRRSPFPGGGELPKRYSHTHDPLVALAFAAAATKKLIVGTGIMLVPQHDPIVTAKAIASLDALSGGRFVFGIGAGWNEDEMENHGVAFKTRFRKMRDYVLAMKAIWTQEEAAYKGEFIQFERMWSWPKPHQRPHPPIILGGESDHTLARIVEYCDGWLPRTRAGFNPGEAVERLKKMADSKGRNFRDLSITVFGAPTKEDALDSYRKAGIQGALLAVPDGTRDEILQFLDKVAPLARAETKAAA